MRTSDKIYGTFASPKSHRPHRQTDSKPNQEKKKEHEWWSSQVSGVCPRYIDK